jgi:hypothetical protein
MKRTTTALVLATSGFAQTKLQKADVTLAPGYTIPIVDREKGQYLGQPTTVLLSDQTALLNVDPKGHGRGAIVHKRSYDAGLTWGGVLAHASSHRRCERQEALIMFSGLYPIRMAVSEDECAN